jgi:hypothetical protein
MQATVAVSETNMTYGRAALYLVCIAVVLSLLIYFEDRLWALWVWLWT